MVNNSALRLDRTFAALTDATRRAILARLEAEGPSTISDIAAPLTIKLPAVLKHLGVLRDAGLITRSKAGRVVTVTIKPEPMKDALDWLKRYERFWGPRLDHLARYAEAKQATAKRKSKWPV
jgi:DNA-binding transcriptional ArsR family regulator